jgi:hypothetical protein
MLFTLLSMSKSIKIYIAIIEQEERSVVGHMTATAIATNISYKYI